MLIQPANLFSQTVCTTNYKLVMKLDLFVQSQPA